MSDALNFTALILAGGYSSRMGNFKPLLPLGKRTVIETTVNVFLSIGVEDVRVVLGYKSEDLIPVLNRLGVRWIYNPDFDQGMYSSIRAGVRTFEETVEGFFLLPGDCPLVKPETVMRVIGAFRKSEARIIYPCYQGVRGHPPLISCTLRDAVINGDYIQGLRTLLGYNETDALNVAVSDEGILLDMDTEEDYRKILDYWSQGRIPKEDDCNVIFEYFHVPERVRAHSKQVRKVSEDLALALNRRGLTLNINLIVAAALLHDLAKGQPKHPETGGKIVALMGYQAAADIISVHQDIFLEDGFIIDEAKIVYLADKLVREEGVVSLKDRFRMVFDRFSKEPDALCKAVERLKNAEKIQDEINRLLGCESFRPVVKSDLL